MSTALLRLDAAWYSATAECLITYMTKWCLAESSKKSPRQVSLEFLPVVHSVNFNV